MPRARQGGPRVGTVGQSYPNRSDLAEARPLPIARIPGQTYGAETAQAALQRVTPMGGTPVATAPGSSGPGAAPAPAPTGPAPGSLPFLHPTNRPSEPVTAGLPRGPGPGPEALGALQPQQNAGQVVAQLASSPAASPDVKALASFVSSGLQ